MLGHLPWSLHWKSLLCLAILPYIKHKLDQIFEDLRHVYTTENGQQRSIPSLLKAFLGVYPYLHMAWEGTVLGYQFLYMFQKCLWHSPFLHLSGTELRNIAEEETIESETFPWSSASLLQRLGYLCRTGLNMTAVTLSTCLSVGVFFLQFLDWWYTSDTSAPSLMSLPTPDPPEKNENIKCPPSNVCPVCHRTRTNDTALAISGYVFCFPCIHGYLKQNGCCPVTGYPAQTEHLIKLYPPDS